MQTNTKPHYPVETGAHTPSGFAALSHPDGTVEMGQIIAIDQNGLSILIPASCSRSDLNAPVQLDVLLVDNDIFLENVNSLIISKRIMPSAPRHIKYNPEAYCYEMIFTDLTPSQESTLGTITTH